MSSDLQVTDHPQNAYRAVDKALGLADANTINRSYMLLKIMETAPRSSRPGVLRYIAENWRDATSSGEIKVDPAITGDELRHLEEKYGPLVDALLEIALHNNPPVDEFYEKLCEVLENPALKDEHVRAFALYWILVDRRIPYFQLEEGLHLSDDDWRDLSNKLRMEKAKLRFILASSINQRSEEADLILRTLDGFGHRERVRLLSFVLWELRELERQLLAAKAS